MKFVLSTSFSTVSHLTAIAPVADTHGWHAMSFSPRTVADYRRLTNTHSKWLTTCRLTTEP